MLRMLNLGVAHVMIDSYSAWFIEEYAPDAPIIVEALIAAEDRRARNHSGIDTFSLLRAGAKFTYGHKLAGVSTIEQQLVRTIFPRRGRLLLIAKLEELILTIRLHRTRSKLSIWLAYLYCAYYGTDMQNYNSVRDFFAKPKAHLNWDQALAIVSCLKYPKPSVQSDRWEDNHSQRVNYLRARLPDPNPRLRDLGYQNGPVEGT